ncbi:class I SAM-dependent methyltransferase [Saccharothrix syringae]|uniref:Class I SAM-dependent methyltransferase n=1 Tax=Saccharothrix syringae TaxID=103733 RepID=A0A5Q0H4L9_SACSY|nr:class I SAM-dependent methyltransferase [Saccharothrix syringae]QFZ21181.1 class I SAM-dependent methyltransferase [Saccharothrix syringae]
MQHYSAESYGEAIAAVFDIVNDDPVEVAGIVDFLRGVAGDGPVLEAGIGTGRIGLPLAASGVELYGVDISQDMVDQLLAKPGADKITVAVGDMNDVDFGREFSLVYLAQGTFGALLEADAQRQFLKSARKQLADGGRLVVETMEVDDSRFTHDQYVTTSLLDVTHVVLSAAIREPEQQLLSIQNVLLSQHGIQLYPVKFRYYTAAELDEMADQAGLRLLERYSDWRKADYTPGDLRHISVYGTN